MPQVLRLVYGRLCIQEFLVVYAVIHKGVDGKVSHSKGGQVLEEVGSLTGVYPVIGQSGFHYHAGSADVRPLHGDAEPGVTATPASGTYKDIVAAFVQELLVQLLYLPGNLLVVGGTIVVCLHIDNVMYLVKDDVASTETKNMYNEYILVTEEGGGKVLESLGMVSTRVDSTYLDLSIFPSTSGTLDEDSYAKVMDAYNNRITLGKLSFYYFSLDYFLDNDNSELKIIAVLFNNTNSKEDVSGSYIDIEMATYIVAQDKTYRAIANTATLFNTMLFYLKFMAKTPKVVTTLASLPIDAHNIIANVASATNLSMAVSSDDVGREWQVRVNNTTGTDITQPLPTSGLFQSMSGGSVVIPKNSFIELSIWYINDKLVIRVGEQA